MKIAMIEQGCGWAADLVASALEGTGHDVWFYNLEHDDVLEDMREINARETWLILDDIDPDGSLADKLAVLLKQDWEHQAAAGQDLVTRLRHVIWVGEPVDNPLPQALQRHGVPIHTDPHVVDLRRYHDRRPMTAERWPAIACNDFPGLVQLLKRIEEE